MQRGRVIAITPNPALGKTLRAAMAAAGAEVRELGSAGDVEPGPLAADLLVFHWLVESQPDDAQGELELAILADLAHRLPAGGHVIVLVPRGDLVTVVAAMAAHPRVAAVLATGRVRAAQLTAITTRLLFGDLFGLGKVLPWGARVHTLAVGDDAARAGALESISAFAAAVGLRRMQRDRIARCCDEMLMNALCDPPGERDGLATDGPPAGKNIGFPLRPGDRAVVEFGCDGKRFAVAVRDRAGHLDRAALLRCLQECTYADESIDDEPRGAGLGLSVLARSASSILFNILPGAAAECICLFDGDATAGQLEQLGVFHERPDQVGRLAPQPPVLVTRSLLRDPPAGPARAASAPSSTNEAAMRTEIIPRLRPSKPWRRSDQDRELDEERRATIQQPRLWRGLARVVGHLPAERARQSSRSLAERVRQSSRSLAQRVRQSSRSLAERIRQIRQNSRSLAAAGVLLLFALSGLAIGLSRLHGAATPGPDAETAQAKVAEPDPESAGDADVPAGALSVTANVPGRVTVEGAPGCRDRALPLERCPLHDGRHKVVISSHELHVRHAFVVEIRGRLVERAVRMGYVEARPGYRLRTATGEPPVARLALPEGRQIVTLTNQAPGTWLELQVPVVVDETVLVP